jgi:hypothetical protein
MMKVTLHDRCLIIGALQVIATCIGAVSCISVLASGDGILGFKVTIGIYLSLCLLSLIIGALLIHGVRTRSPGLLLLWLLTAWILPKFIIAGIIIIINVYEVAVIGSQLWSALL